MISLKNRVIICLEITHKRTKGIKMKKWLLIALALLPTLAFAEDTPTLDTGDTAWMM
ncbi:MAG: hypothetical protein ACI9TV_000776, partial [Sulfurimonas sp.]